MEPTPSAVLSAPKPFELVTLRDMKDGEGNAAVIRVGRLDPEALGRVQGQLPGEVPTSTGPREIDPVRAVNAGYEWAIAACLEPRFARIAEPGEGVYPVSWLSQRDLEAIATCAMSLAGVGGDSFRDEDQEGEEVG